jgi:hypothetical protein
MGDMTTADLIGTPEAAKLLDKSPRTIHRMVKAGLLTPAFTAPGGPHGAYLFERTAIEQVRDQRSARAAS